MHDLRIEPFAPAMTTEAAQMLARAFVSNPLHVAAFGPDQQAKNEVFFRTGLAAMKGPKRVAFDGSRLLGFIHWVSSSDCQFSGPKKLRVVPAMLRGFGLRSATRVSSWLSAWSKHDPQQPHVHLGPIGVDPAAQGQGVGRRLMELYCEELDRTGQAGYLETDRPENVAFYRSFGFTTTTEVSVIGVRNYFMWRAAQSRSPA